MSLEERVYSVLVVSRAGNFSSALTGLRPPSRYDPVHVVGSLSEAKRSIAENVYDMVIVNSPLPDGSGVGFSGNVCRSGSGQTVALLVMRAEENAENHDRAVEQGVFTLTKPTSRMAMATALDWLASARERLRSLERRSMSIEERMEEIRVVNRAKFLLISELKMTEPEAHRYIEKGAMDSCISKKEMAQRIIKTYS